MLMLNNNRTNSIGNNQCTEAFGVTQYRYADKLSNDLLRRN